MDLFPVLLVEDDENDILFVRNAFKQAQVRNPLAVVVSGDEALDYLLRTGRFAGLASSPLPGLILMDVNTSGKRNGLEVLRQIRADPRLKHILVILWSSTAPPAAINEAYANGANSFLIKPGDTRDLAELVRLIKAYWLERNQLPTPAPTGGKHP
jgi:CheY-like chemotaxis protein